MCALFQKENGINNTYRDKYPRANNVNGKQIKIPKCRMTPSKNAHTLHRLCRQIKIKTASNKSDV